MLLTEIPMLFKALGIDFAGVQGLEISPSREIVGEVYLTRDNREVARYGLDSKRSVIWHFQGFHPDHCKIHFDIQTKDTFPLTMVVPASKEELKTVRNAMPLNLGQDGGEQPAIRSESKPEGKQEAELESEVRPR